MEQSNAEAHSGRGRPEAVKGQRVQGVGLWQELKLTVSDIVKQPAIMQ